MKNEPFQKSIYPVKAEFIMRKYISFLLLLVIAISCVKEQNTDTIQSTMLKQGENKDLIISTKKIDKVTNKSGGKIMLLREGINIMERGVCYSPFENPTVLNNRTSDGAGEGEFSSDPTGFSLQATNYIRAYAITDKDTSYGDQLTYTFSLSVGMNFAGGIVFDMDYSGHGMVCAVKDQSEGATWGSGVTMCDALNMNGYDDWYLPSIGELQKMYRNLVYGKGLGGFLEGYYWSSTEYVNSCAYCFDQLQGNSDALDQYKTKLYRIRAVRAF
jgi:hypothetical protein